MVALIALFASLGGTVYAAATINGKSIRKNSIPANRIKKDSLTGAQVNEGSLGVVPSAARAQEVATAPTAERATSAAHADVAARADSAPRAARAGTAAEADHAQNADEATVANDARELAGHPVAEHFRADLCETETIEAAVAVNTPTRTTVAAAAHFNCAGGIPEFEVRKEGEVVVTFPGLPPGIPVVSSAAGGNEASVQPLPVAAGAPGKYRVTTYDVVAEELIAGSFTLAIFSIEGHAGGP